MMYMVPVFVGFGEGSVVAVHLGSLCDLAGSGGVLRLSGVESRSLSLARPLARKHGRSERKGELRGAVRGLDQANTTVCVTSGR
eukprot:6196757-Pleurochrysis_carterae.AAC.2